MRPLRIARLAIPASIVLTPAGAHAAALDGSHMGWGWPGPFAGILLSIAFGPLLFPRVWHAHYGKIAAGWAFAALVPLAVAFGADTALAAFVDIMLGDYLSFIVLLFAL